MATHPSLPVALIIISIIVIYDSLNTSGIDYAMAFVATPSAVTSKSEKLMHIEPSSIFYARLISEDIEKGEQQGTSPSPSLLSRKKFNSNIFSSAVSALLFPTLHPQSANADDPANLYYRSKADEDDPLAVFGKSLQNMSFDSTGTSLSPPESGSENASSLTFSDIAPPSSSSESTPPMGGGDLNKALQEKKESQKRRVDPRTHG
mmetsp:Transcript_11567/g.24666  ORF Transcript_11567/g.24666 Transcript_11567/m.24666 type:complete len:205 (+) Transcript_11567:173-787(+)|eukprot:CAMPEP_0183740446 /NCGR_PEP_ID=MMETSP0737-20130205/59644_1 /TAXON_ID=385413 /ORGANISM="Thalassiosira miniscula, Strain CCMP1093" /LENGTH=204 /DNA_ID=CAMNT_0025975505 /DNA_START=66 /DNA_END=680 /DNA_ORIENTATION=+